MKFRALWREHSLTVVLFVGYAISTVASSIVEHGSWAYDYWMMMAGSFGGSALLVALSTTSQGEQDGLV